MGEDEMKAIMVCVDYADLLEVTLERNVGFFDKILVVSTERDAATKSLVDQYRGTRVSLYNTDAFYRDGADFNKGLAMEEGFDVLGRDGWITILDADIVLPVDFHDQITKYVTDPQFIYGPYRRMCVKPEAWNGGYDWAALPRVPDREIAGYCQVFNAEAPALQAKPWYGTTWKHAGGCDSVFQAKFPVGARIRMPFDVLHLGQHGVNWHGRVTQTLVD
jgi:hypothetical protein